MESTRQKVQPEHLKRNAYLYIRQSSLQQVFHNQESTRRQYDLRRRAVALGWNEDQIIVIDTDLGLSGASSADRKGFQRLVAEVGMGKAGIVLGLEVSRLARNSSDWHRLLEISALANTLILDEDGVYDPADFNDRLLLGMKGTMSEAELHIIRARLQGGLRNKARRGELQVVLPVGLSYDILGKVILEPDKQVQQTLFTFFKTFNREGSALGAVKFFRKNNLPFPRKMRGDLHHGKIIWGPLTHTRALQMLHNPRYAGTFVFGRTRTTKDINGKVRIASLPMDQWHTVLPDTHPGYLTWQQYNDNVKTLRTNSHAYNKSRQNYPPGKGPALLQGLVLCGVCGQRMTLRYHSRDGKLIPDYTCQRHGIDYGLPICQCIPGINVEKAIGDILLELVKPVSMELALTVQQEVQERIEESDKMRYQKVQRVKYEADIARDRFMSVDPRNRLVADQLEADWNAKLRILNETQQEYEKQKQSDRVKLDEKCRKQIMDLVKDFPKIWNDPATTNQQKKRIIRLLVEDVTLTRNCKIVKMQIRFKGGMTKTLQTSVPLSAWEDKKTDQKIIAEIDELINHYTDFEIAKNLNRRGITPSMAPKFKAKIIAKLRRRYNLKPRYDRLREKGLLTVDEMAKELAVSSCTVKTWRKYGLFKGIRYNDKDGRLYELPPKENRPCKCQGPKSKLIERKELMPFITQATNEVQHES